MKSKNPKIALSKEQNDALYPALPVENRSKLLPYDSFILGQSDEGYFSYPIEEKSIINAYIVGQPGAGKTVLLMSWLLTWHITRFVLDVKNGELQKLSTTHNDPNVCIVSPTYPDSYGWDVYYKLTEKEFAGKKVTQDDVIAVADQVAKALIVSHNPKDKYFINSARRILKGILLYFYGKKQWIADGCIMRSGFVDAILEINEQDLSELIQQALSDRAIIEKFPKIKGYLSKYKSMKGETFDCISSTLNENLEVFLNDDIIYCLRDNPHKANPSMLNDGISIYWSIKLDKLDEYSGVFRLATYQTIAELESRDDAKKYPITAVVIDEAPRIGKLENLISSIGVSRGLRFFFVIVTQDEEQMFEHYGEHDAKTLWNICRLRCIIGTENVETINKMRQLAGTYIYKQISHPVNGLTGVSGSMDTATLVEKDIVDARSVTTLIDLHEMVVFLNGRYFRTKQVQYWKDPALRQLSEEIAWKNGSK